MTVRILHGDCRDVLAKLPEASVHCCVTSPPYWGLRDYGIPPSVWGGDAACAHDWGEGVRVQALCKDIDAGAFCTCGAWRGAFGLEPTWQIYVAHAVEVFRAVRRVLRADGTLWLNIGDSYATGAGQGKVPGGGGQGNRFERISGHWQPNRKRQPGLKPKDLCGIPWRVAIALQDDGWWLRQDIIWSKPNPMPESVTDRCTKSHEYLFLFGKSARYHYDAEAIKEEVSDDTHPRGPGNRRHKGTDAYSAGDEHHRTKQGLVRYSARKLAQANSGVRNNRSFDDAMAIMPEKRNKRSVWTVASQPFPGAHFAMFPPALIEPAILAGCPKDGTVLDPFGGAGTTGLVADRLQRDAILIELNPDYVAMAQRRIEQDAPLLAHNAEASA
jgi:DNA modification methylase